LMFMFKIKGGGGGGGRRVDEVDFHLGVW
jgi:hypothetical protein